MRQGTIFGAVRSAVSVIAAVVLMASPALAGVLNIYGSAAPTVDLPGYTTFTLSVETDVADIQGFDFLGGEAVGDYGFFGAMNQLNPNGVATIFNDFNGAMPLVGRNSAQDSQFMLSSSDLLSIRPSESASQLRGAFATFRPIGKAFSFAQIVVPDGDTVSFRGVLGYDSQRTDLGLQEIAGQVGQGLLFSKEVMPLPPPAPYVPPSPPPVTQPTIPPVAPAPPSNERLGKFSILGSAAPTPGLAGHTTYTLSLQTDVADVGALDFLGGRDVGEFGFFGPMHQVHPSDVGTVFSDQNGVIDAFGGDSRQDSQFLFQSSDILSIRPGESDESLQAAFAGFESFGTDFAFAQIVVHDGAEVSFNGQLAYRDPDLDLPVQSFAGVVGTGVLFEADVFRPQAPVLPEPEPTPTPPPLPVPQPTPEPVIETETPPNLPPEPIIEVGPTEPLPPEPEPTEPGVPEEPGYVIYPVDRPPLILRPGWNEPAIDVIRGPYVIDYTEFPPGAVIAIDPPIESFLFASDHDTPYYLFDNGIRTSAIAFDGTSASFFRGNVESQVPEPAAWCQSVLVLMGIIAFRRWSINSR